MNILIVEDDVKINQFLQRGLKEAGHLSISATNGKEAIDIIENTSTIDAIVLDLMLPEISGIDVLKCIRSKGINIPVIILSAKRTVDDKIAGLQIGADDYLEKPFSFSELLARIQALVRRNAPSKAEKTELNHCGVKLDLLTRKVTRDDKTIDLQAKELALLEYFLRNPDRIVTKTMILENVYGYNFDTQTNVVDVLVHRLRSKIEDGFECKIIHTLRGLGYVLKRDE
ncbi:MAG: response regulator transcription factor [Bacteriovoracaceae bacterium]